MKYFITGTDTDIGKTYISLLMMEQLKSRGLKVIGIKPIATGGYKNDDALRLQRKSSVMLPYDKINPFCYKDPTSPNIAIDLNNSKLSIDLLNRKIDFNDYKSDVLIIEGAGGVLVPINSKETLLDWIKYLNIEVILVVGIKLGCINHSLLTCEVLRKYNIKLKGWIANCMQKNFSYIQENINTLKNYISAPCLGEISFNGKEKLLI